MISPKEFVEQKKIFLKEYIKEQKLTPSLAIINTLESPATSSYIKGKVKDAEEIGIKADVFRFEDNLSPSEFCYRIKKLPHDAIIIQLPLHPNYEPFKDELLHAIPYYKDVDGLSSYSIFNPCTPKGIMDFLDYNEVELQGAKVTIIGRSDLVGRPLARLMLDADATVTMCHSRTKDLKEHTLNADIIVCAVGSAALLTDKHVKHDKSQIVIDVGINRVDGKLCGDVSPSVLSFVKYLTPVPGGVGLLTRLALMENTIVAAWLKKEENNE